jgi:acyl-CoA synthetase (AMP-forming)/AMP-acid ligase II
MGELIDAHLSAEAWITADTYPKMYARSIKNPAEFWHEQALRYLHWFRQAVYAFVTVLAQVTPDESLRRELINWVRQKIGAFAAPEYIQWAPELPKTRSGKILRRILRKIVNGETDNLGDTSTLANPAVINNLISHR